MYNVMHMYQNIAGHLLCILEDKYTGMNHSYCYTERSRDSCAFHFGIRLHLRK